jgi:hypothetical protein
VRVRTNPDKPDTDRSVVLPTTASRRSVEKSQNADVVCWAMRCRSSRRNR